MLLVVTCGDLPILPNAIAPPNIVPWYPGSRDTYVCKTEYKLKDELVRAECKINGAEAIWTDLGDIKCIPSM